MRGYGVVTINSETQLPTACQIRWVKVLRTLPIDPEPKELSSYKDRSSEKANEFLRIQAGNCFLYGVGLELRRTLDSRKNGGIMDPPLLSSMTPHLSFFSLPPHPLVLPAGNYIRITPDARAVPSSPQKPPYLAGGWQFPLKAPRWQSLGWEAVGSLESLLGRSGCLCLLIDSFGGDRNHCPEGDGVK